jgi:DNA-binding NtrC family response regulator
MKASKTIVVVATELAPKLTNLVTNLGTRGFHVIEAGEQELDTTLHRDNEVAVLVYEHRGEGVAKRILRTLQDSGRDVPVVVVFDQADKEDYYDLMSKGAYDFFELSERPESIMRSVCWAATASGPQSSGGNQHAKVVAVA